MYLNTVERWTAAMALREYAPEIAKHDPRLAQEMANLSHYIDPDYYGEDGDIPQYFIEKVCTNARIKVLSVRSPVYSSWTRCMRSVQVESTESHRLIYRTTESGHCS